MRESPPMISKLTASIISSLLIAAIAVEASNLRSFKVPVSTMAPTIPLGSKITGDMTAYREHAPKRWDVVLFDPPPSAGEGHVWILRVVGLPGERVDITSSGVLLINGEPLQPPSDLSGVRWLRRPDPRTITVIHPFTVPADSYYVLGDNSESAVDSRLWGALPRKNILGKVVTPDA